MALDPAEATRGDEPGTTSAEAAEALASTPLFAGLSPVDLARLVPELEELSFAAEARVFAEGEAGDGLYIIRRGVARVGAGDSGGESGQTLALLGAPEYFGEMALLSDGPRSATVEAVTPLEVWRLSRERFHELIADHPTLPLEMSAALSRRLAATDRELTRTRRDLHALAREVLSVLPPAARELLLRASPLREIDPRVLERALDRDGLAELFAAIDRRSRFIERTPSGSYCLVEPWMRDALCQELRQELGEVGYRDWLDQLVDALEVERDWVGAADLALEAEQWAKARRFLALAGPELREVDPAGLERRLRRLPIALLNDDAGLVRLLAASCVAQDKPEQAIDACEQAIEASVGRGEVPAPALERELTRLYAESGRAARALGSIELAMDEIQARESESGFAGGGGMVGVLPQAESPEESLRRGGLALAGARGLARASAAARALLWPRGQRHALAMLLGLVLLTLWLLPPPPGLSQAGLRALVLLLASLAVSLLGLVPEYLSALLLLALWVVSGTVPVELAASGFASPTWFLLLSTMAVGTGLARSGLLYRAALELLERLPPRYPVLATALAVLGVLVSPGMPNVSGRVSLAGPVAQDIADSLRYPPRSGGSAGLALATYLGFGQMSALFLTASPSALILYGLMPNDVRAQISFVSWFLVALPLQVVLFVGMLAFILWRYRPEGGELSEATLQVQRAVLGRPSRGERVALGVLLFLLIGFSTQQVHQIDAAWLGLFAVAVMIASGLLTTDALRSGVNWPFLLFLGVTLSLGEVFRGLEINLWMGQVLQPIVLVLAQQPGVFVVGIGLVALLLALVLRMGTTVLLLALAIFPIGAQIGISPWVVALTLLVAANQWLYPQQSVVYLTLYYASDERAFSHAQVRPAAFVFAGLSLLGLAVSVPYWRWLGLLG